MALLTGFSGKSFSKFGRQILLALGDDIGILAPDALAADATFDKKSASVLFLDAGAANRNVTAVADAEIAGMFKFFKNAGAANNLVIRSSAPATLATLTPGDWCCIFHTGSAWKAATSASLASILATASTWSALQTFGAGAALKDSVSYFYDEGDATKKLAFQCNGIATATTRTLTAPDSDGMLVLLALAQILQNKTLDNTNTVTIKDTLFTLQDDGDAAKQLRLQLSGITTGNTRVITVPDSDGTLVYLALAQSLTNKTFDNTNIFSVRDDRFTLQDSGDTTKQAVFEASGITTSTTRTYTLPDASGTLALLALAQTFQNKTLDNTNIVTLRDDRFTLQDDGDAAKQAQFQLSGITTGNTRVYTMPDASGTLALLGLAQSWTALQTFNSNIASDVIAEKTAGAGVTVDSLKIKDGNIVADWLPSASIAVANASGGATDAALTVDLTRSDTTVLTSARQIMIVAGSIQYAPFHTAEASVSYGTATKGSIIASGQGWCLAETDAAGEFDCTVTNTDDETLYFRVESAPGGTDPTKAARVLYSNVDAATWSA